MGPLSGWYMTTVDLLLQLWIPIFVPAFVMGVSWLSFWVWLLVVEVDGVHSHAALDFGWPMPSPRRHWLHHSLFTCNYSNGFFDAIIGTEAQKALQRRNTTATCGIDRKLGSPNDLCPKDVVARRVTVSNVDLNFM